MRPAAPGATTQYATLKAGRDAALLNAGGRTPPGPAVWGASCGGCCVLFVTLVLCTFFTFYHYNVVFAILALGLVSTVAALEAAREGKLKSFLHYGEYSPVPLAACLGALLLGLALGPCLYYGLGRPALVYENTRIYRNVVPSAPAGSFADGGRLLFAQEARVNTSLAVGYQASNGHRYCAAPIQDLAALHYSEFWAVGKDCCTLSASFDCGVTSGALSGIVEMDRRGLLQGSQSDRANFEAARRKAEATAGLAPAGEEATYVRLVTAAEAASLPGDLRRVAWVSILLICLGYFAVSFSLALVLLRRFAVLSF